MLKLIVRRLPALIFVLFCVVSLTFFLIRLAPGGPFDRERKIPPAIEAQLLAKYELDGPLWQQFTGYIADVARGDLRLSTKYRNRSVNEILAQTLPVTFALGGIAFVLATIGGIWLGTFAAVRRDTAADRIAMGAALLGLSIPMFVVGPILVLVFGLWLKWLLLIIVTLGIYSIWVTPRLFKWVAEHTDIDPDLAPSSAIPENSAYSVFRMIQPRLLSPK